jgi:hypothetical protein
VREKREEMGLVGVGDEVCEARSKMLREGDWDKEHKLTAGFHCS